MSHHCHALRCKTHVPPSMLMCRAHWDLVPVPMRMEVIRHYRRGQCRDGKPSKAWVLAAVIARNHVAKLEGVITAEQAEQLEAPLRAAVERERASHIRGRSCAYILEDEVQDMPEETP